MIAEALELFHDARQHVVAVVNADADPDRRYWQRVDVGVYSHRIHHLNLLRDLQDKTGGFNSFIPLKYRNENNALSDLPEISFEEDMRNFCVSRIFLDNIKHLKAYWVMLGIDNAVEALSYGVDDLDGTVDDSTKIYSMAGGMENPALTSDVLRELIVGKGKIPVERDSLYQKVL